MGSGHRGWTRRTRARGLSGDHVARRDAELEHHGPDRGPVYRLRQLRTAIPAMVRDEKQRHAPPMPDPIMVSRFRRLLAERRPEVVVSHGWISASVERAMRGSEIPLVLSSHDYGFFCPIRTLLYKGRPCTGPGPAKCLGCARDYYGAAKGALTVAGVAHFKRVAPAHLWGSRACPRSLMK